MTGSLRAYARHRGCTLRAVQKAVESKRISLTGGKVDFEQADRDWQKNTFVGASLGQQAKTKPVPIAPVQRTGPDPNQQYLAARAAKETFLAKKAQLEYEQQAGKLMETQKGSEYASSFSQLIKDHLLALPDRLAPILAAVDDAEAARKILIGDVGVVLKKLNKAISDAGL
jgi:hypothetical protein